MWWWWRDQRFVSGPGRKHSRVGWEEESWVEQAGTTWRWAMCRDIRLLFKSSPAIWHSVSTLGACPWQSDLQWPWTSAVAFECQFSVYENCPYPWFYFGGECQFGIFYWYLIGPSWKCALLDLELCTGRELRKSRIRGSEFWYLWVSEAFRGSPPQITWWEALWLKLGFWWSITLHAAPSSILAWLLDFVPGLAIVLQVIGAWTCHLGQAQKFMQSMQP